MQEVLNLMKRMNILKNIINIWLLDSIQFNWWLILFLKRFFAVKKSPLFFSASMKTGVKLLGGTVTRVCEYSLRHSRPKVSVNVWQDRSCRTRGPLICEKQIEIILLGHICFISHLFTKSIQDTYTGTNLKFIEV